VWPSGAEGKEKEEQELEQAVYIVAILG
jgi:hypothetical protein